MNLNKSIFYIAPFFVIIGLTWLVFSGFQIEEELTEQEQTWIDEAVQEKINNYRENRLVRCRKRVLEKANEVVDSTLVARAKLLIDKYNSGRPERPLRPFDPRVILPKPTVPIAPIFSLDSFYSYDTLLQDSVLQIDTIYQDSLLMDSLNLMESIE